MSMDNIPIWGLFAATIILVAITIEAGYRLGYAAHQASKQEKESPVSVIAASILGLLAFILAFTFDIVSDRYDARKALVRDEANAIRTAWLRSDFLPEPDRSEAEGILLRYLDLRLAAVESYDLDQVHKAMIESEKIQRQLWNTAVVNARKDMNSDVAALYIESLNELANFHALRVAIGLQTRIPMGIWLALYALVMLGMIAIGYQTSIAGSRRSWATVLLALSFSFAIVLIAILDRPQSGYFPVTQQPMIDLRASMAEKISTH